MLAECISQQEETTPNDLLIFFPMCGACMWWCKHMCVHEGHMWRPAGTLCAFPYLSQPVPLTQGFSLTRRLPCWPAGWPTSSRYPLFSVPNPGLRHVQPWMLVIWTHVFMLAGVSLLSLHWSICLSSLRRSSLWLRMFGSIRDSDDSICYIRRRL